MLVRVCVCGVCVCVCVCVWCVCVCVWCVCVVCVWCVWCVGSGSRGVGVDVGVGMGRNVGVWAWGPGGFYRTSSPHLCPRQLHPQSPTPILPAHSPNANQTPTHSYHPTTMTTPTLLPIQLQTVSFLPPPPLPHSCQFPTPPLPPTLSLSSTMRSPAATAPQLTRPALLGITVPKLKSDYRKAKV